MGHAIKQVDRFFSNTGVDVWELFATWVPFVIASLDRRGGTILDVAERGAAVRLVSGEAPLRRLFGYATDLRSLTQGRATFTLRLDRFDVAR